MEAVFLKLLNMSITASWLVLVVVVLRLLLKKSPKVLFCVLWGLVGLRLVCPFSFESILSLIPSAETVSPDIIYSQKPTIDSGVPVFNSTVNPIISENLAPVGADSVNPMQIITFIASIIWVVGVVVMVLYATISFLRLSKRVQEAVLKDKNIYICDRIPSPFILGIFRPRIYLPSSMNEEDMEYVIAHEKAHIKRGDHFWKPLGFALLSVYWFNPVLWVAYILLCRDIEFACDEKVIKNMGAEIKKPYSTALINCSVNRKIISACPLAFGEVGVKGRIKSVLNYKKPAFWIICVALIASLVVSACFLTNPKSEQDVSQSKNGSDIEGVSIEITDSDFSSINPYIKIEWSNKTDKDITYGEEFYIKHNGEDCRQGEYIWNDIGYMLKAGESTTKKYTLADITMTEPGKYRFETSYSVDGAKPYKEYKVWVEFELNESVELIYNYVLEPVGQIYKMYEMSNYGPLDMFPDYKITRDMHWLEIPDNESEIKDCGVLTEIKLNKRNFDSRFRDPGDEFMTKYIRKKNNRAWEIDYDSGKKLIMEQKDGTFYLAFCSKDEDPEPNEDDYYIYWVYLLEKRPVTSVSVTPETITEKESTAVATLPIPTTEKLTTTTNKTTTINKTTVAKTKAEKTKKTKMTVVKTTVAKLKIPNTILLPNGKSIEIFALDSKSSSGHLAEVFTNYTTKNNDTVMFDKATNRLLSVSFSESTYSQFSKVAEEDRKGFVQKFAKTFCNPEDYPILKMEGTEQTPIYTFIKQYQGIDSSNRYSVTFNQEGYIVSVNYPRQDLFADTEPFEKADLAKCEKLLKEAMKDKGTYVVVDKVFALKDGEHCLVYICEIENKLESGEKYFTGHYEYIPL